MKKNQIIGAILFFIVYASINTVLNCLLSVPNVAIMAIVGAVGGLGGVLCGYEIGKADATGQSINKDNQTQVTVFLGKHYTMEQIADALEQAGIHVAASVECDGKYTLQETLKEHFDSDKD